MNEINRKRDAFKLALEIFNEIKGHRWNLPIPNFFNTGKKCGFDGVYTRLLISMLKENNIIRDAASHSVKFTQPGYDLMLNTIENPDNPPYYFPPVADLLGE